MRAIRQSFRGTTPVLMPRRHSFSLFRDTARLRGGIGSPKPLRCLT